MGMQYVNMKYMIRDGRSGVWNLWDPPYTYKRDADKASRLWSSTTDTVHKAIIVSLQGNRFVPSAVKL